MLWSHSKFLKRTHRTNTNEKELNIFLERIRPLRNGYAWNGIMGVYPKGDRALRALNTAIAAYTFICFHEVGHLVRAHIPFIHQETNLQLQTLLEHNNSLGVSNFKQIQSLEVDADMYAARAITDFAMTNWNMGLFFPLDIPVNKGEIFTYITDLFIAMALAFFCIDISSRSSSLNSKSTHPPPAVRLAISVMASSRLLQHPFKIPQEVITKSFITALQEIQEFWSILKLPARTFNNNNVDKILRRTVHYFKELGPILENLTSPMDLRLRRLGTSYDHYNQFSSFYDVN
jgi:hypothetical protein